MSPLSIYRHIPTVLDLNGPSLEFTTQPTGLTTTIGYAVTFSGAGTTSLSIINAQFVEDHNDEFYLQADFKPVGYWRPGNESPNPNAINNGSAGIGRKDDSVNETINKVMVP